METILNNTTNKVSYDETILTYENQYKNGYGLSYPEGHVIRTHLKILKYELGMSGGKILDYGCGTGGHLEYFLKNGYQPFGCDTSETAIRICKSQMPEYEKNFQVIQSVPRLRDYFSDDFDVILSNQVLYYLSDVDINNITSQFYEMLKPGGVFIVTLISPENYLHKYIVSKEGDLSKVMLTGRLNQLSYINFKTKEEWLKMFNKFTKLHFGWYTSVIREEEGRTDHFIFVGKK